MPIRSAEQNAFQPAPIINKFQKRRLNTETNQSYVRGGQVNRPPPGINAFQPPQSTGNYQQKAVGGHKTVQLPPGFEHLQPIPGFKQIGPPPGFGYDMNSLLTQSSAISLPKTQYQSLSMLPSTYKAQLQGIQKTQNSKNYQQQAVKGQKTVQPPPGFEHIQPLPGFKHLQPHPGFKQIGPPPGFGCNINRLLSQSSITQPKTQ